MSFQPHLQIFNSSRVTHEPELAFSLFPRLPAEIRLKIWELSLQRQRIIRVKLKSRAEDPVTQPGESTESASKSERYHALVDGHQGISKLLRVNNEARHAALHFYRIHLPCTLVTETTGKRVAKPGILYLNPEYDFLHISSWHPVRDTLIDFLYHLKTSYDPRRVGLLNLAVDLNSLNANDLRLTDLSDLNAHARLAFVETLIQLQELFFVCIERAGRQILGYTSGIPTPDTIFNRSLPIMAMTPTFERLHHDPRPIAQDLRQVYGGTSDPREMLYLWRQLLKKWSISNSHLGYRFLLAFIPFTYEDDIYDIGCAQWWLQKEDDMWNGRPWALGSQTVITSPVGALTEKYKNEDLEQAVKPAFGFWLFPIEALGALPEDGGFWFEPKRLLNMTGHWPELALLSLP